MATIFDAAADRILRTSGLIDWDADFTYMGWRKINSNTGGLQTFFSLNDDVPNEYIFWGVLSNLTHYIERGNTGLAISGSTLSTGTWYHVALVHNAAGSPRWQIYLNAVSEGTDGDTGTKPDPTRMEAGGWLSANGNRLDGKCAYDRAWTRALNSTEIATEKAATSAVSSTNLYGDWPLISDILDISGNGRDWTQGGALTFDADSPLATATPVPVFMNQYRQRWR
jgi:hypothetical protein